MTYSFSVPSITIEDKNGKVLFHKEEEDARGYLQSITGNGPARVFAAIRSKFNL
jgi:hypothetical protein